MSDIKDWPNTAAGFNSLSIPDSAPENGTTVAQINDVIREEQAATRRYYETMEWREFGYGISTNGTASVTFSEAIPLFIIGQRVKISHNTSVTSYGTITNNSSQILTITVDGGTTLVSVTAVAAGFSPTGDPAGIADVIGITTQGDVITGDSSGDHQRLALGTSGQALVSDGTDAVWGAPTGSFTHSGTNFTTTGGLTLGEATNIPTTANQVVVNWTAVTSSAVLHAIWLGDASYAYGTSSTSNRTNAGVATQTNGSVSMTDDTYSGGSATHGSVTFTRISGTQVWTVSGNLKGTADTRVAGYITVTGVTARIKVATASGTMGAGTASVYWL